MRAPPRQLDPSPYGDAGWRALGTGVRVLTADPSAIGTARHVVEAELAAIDLAASRFRADSEVSRLAAAGGRSVAVSPLLAAALAAALRAARLTGGAVDPTVGGMLVELGYDRDYSLLDTAPAGAQPPAGGSGGGRVTTPGGVWAPAGGRVTVRGQVSWQSVELDAGAGRVRVPPGTLLDLGATAKAFAADRAAAAAARAAGCGVLVSLGGDIAVAGTAPGCGWRVLVTDDHARPTGGQVVTVRSGGLATSSTSVRRWSRGGTQLHHLLDPETGQPAGGPWRTVSVAAATCLDANVASTATIVLGSRGERWLAGTGLPARLVGGDGSVRLLPGWPEEGG